MQLWAAQLTGDFADSIRQLSQHAECEVWLGLSSKLIRKAGRIVPLQQIRRVDHTTGEVGNIKAGKRVGLSEVAADVQELGLKAKTSAMIREGGGMKSFLLLGTRT